MASKRQDGNAKWLSLGRVYSFLRRCIFRVISVGPLPNHIAFIMDGNRRYAKKHNLTLEDGYRRSFFTLMSILKYCYELQIRYVSVYAFGIDNFRRKQDDVTFLMGLLEEKIEGLLEQESVTKEYGLRVIVLGNLNLLTERVRVAVENAMAATAMNSNIILHVCLAYTATDEIVHAVEQCCYDRWRDEAQSASAEQGERKIELADIEEHMYLSVAPEPDILVRTAGETRLSNFILWHTQSCLLHSPTVLWPELGMWDMVWAVLNFQRHHQYLQKKKKQS